MIREIPGIEVVTPLGREAGMVEFHVEDWNPDELSSFSGFLGYASMGNIDTMLLTFTAIGSAAGAVLGSWLMIEKLKPKQVKLVVGTVLLGIAAKMTWNLVG